jgi:type II secretion system protein E
MNITSPIDGNSSFAAMLLKASGLYSEDAVGRIFAGRDANPGMSLAEAAVKFGGVKEKDFLAGMGKVLGLNVVNLELQNPSPDALQKLPASAVYQYNALPFSLDEKSITVVASDPFDTSIADGLRLAAGMSVNITLAPKEDVEKAIKKFYGVGAEAIEKMLEDGRYDVGEDFGAMTKIDVGEMGEEASIVRFVNQIIAEADRQGATDIHIEPQETELRIRYRIDGMLHKVDVPPQLNRLKSAIISRIKVMANLDIAEKRLPMDGRIGIRIQGQDIDIRVSTMPAAYGESVSLRLLAKSGSFVKMCDLGFNERDFAVVDKIIHRPNGIFLVTGPTGSGKSTSLYSFLSEVNKIDVRIMTAEDPIEYHMAGINQVQMQSEIGMDFARALRAFLRQDPDIIMVGEIRDRETAEIAINASLTGHMVFSTLHTNDAAGAFPRLIDMGVEPFLIASAVAGVMGQRLCRRLCPDCRREVALDRKYYTLEYPPAKETVFEPGGCDACSRTGYKGRRALFEVLDVDEDIEGAIVRRENATQIRNLSLSKGMKTLREDGWAKVFKGVTSVKEVLRVTEDQ